MLLSLSKTPSGTWHAQDFRDRVRRTSFCTRLKSPHSKAVVRDALKHVARVISGLSMYFMSSAEMIHGWLYDLEEGGRGPEESETLASMNFVIVIFFLESSKVLPQRCLQDGCTIRRFDSRSQMNDGRT